MKLAQARSAAWLAGWDAWWTSGAARWLTPRRLAVYPTAVALLTVLAQGLNFWIGTRWRGEPAILMAGGDFIAYYTAGRFWLEGRLHQVYNPAAVSAFQHALPGLQAVAGYDPYLNPPIAALLWAPFALGSYWQGLVLWWLAGLGALAASVTLFRRYGLPPGGPAVSRLLRLALLFNPVLVCFFFGQNSAFTLLVFTAFFVLLRHRHDLAAGAVLGLLVYKPQLALGLALVLLVQRRWRALLGGGLVGGGLLVLGWALSPAATLGFFKLVPAMLPLQRLAGWAENSLAFVGYLLLDGVSPAAGSVAGAVLTLAGLALLVRWWWRKPWTPGTPAWDLALAATLVVAWLSSPHLYSYDLLLLLLPLGIVTQQAWPGATRLSPLPPALLAWTAALYLAAWLGSYMTALQLRVTTALGGPSLALPVGVLILLGWAVHVQRLAWAAEANATPLEAGRAASAVAGIQEYDASLRAL